MKNFIELKYKKNSRFEIEFENLDEIKEGDNVILYYSNDIEAVLLSLKLPFNVNLYIPYIAKTIADNLDNILSNVNLYTLDSGSEVLCQGVILPKWNIPEDNAVLFLSEGDMEKYAGSYHFNDENPILCYSKENNIINVFGKNADRYYGNAIEPYVIPKISIIIPQLHQDNIQEINNIAKELKEKYWVEEVNVFASHCFINLTNLITLEKLAILSNRLEKAIMQKESLECDDIKYINKITTTNSTGILEVQKSDRLEVIDIKEFFV